MAMTPLELSRAFQEMSRTVEIERRASLARSATKARSAVLRERDRAVGSDGRLSGAGNALLGVKVKVRDDDAVVSATGPWQLVENDTRPAGLIVGKTWREGRNGRPGRYRRTLSRGTSERTKFKRYLARTAFATGRASFAGVRPLRTPYGPRSKVFDKGTRGKKPFQKGVDAAVPIVTSELSASVRGAVRSAFGRS